MAPEYVVCNKTLERERERKNWQCVYVFSTVGSLSLTDGDCVAATHTVHSSIAECTQSRTRIFRENPSSALPCCSCVHYTLMPKLNKGLSPGDFGGVAELKWAKIKCPWIERRNSQHRDFHHPSALIRVYESRLKASNIASTSRLWYRHIKLLHIDLAASCVYVWVRGGSCRAQLCSVQQDVLNGVVQSFRSRNENAYEADYFVFECLPNIITTDK